MARRGRGRTRARARSLTRPLEPEFVTRAPDVSVFEAARARDQFAKETGIGLSGYREPVRAVEAPRERETPPENRMQRVAESLPLAERPLRCKPRPAPRRSGGQGRGFVPWCK